MTLKYDHGFGENVLGGGRLLISLQQLKNLYTLQKIMSLKIESCRNKEVNELHFQSRESSSNVSSQLMVVLFLQAAPANFGFGWGWDLVKEFVRRKRNEQNFWRWYRAGITIWKPQEPLMHNWFSIWFIFKTQALWKTIELWQDGKCPLVSQYLAETVLLEECGPPQTRMPSLLRKIFAKFGGDKTANFWRMSLNFLWYFKMREMET